MVANINAHGKSITIGANTNAYRRDLRDFQQQCYKTYVRADVGYSWPDRKILVEQSRKPHGAFIGSLGMGYAIHPRFKTDVTATYRGLYKYSVYPVKEDFYNFALMLNGYFSPIAFDKAIPYIMAGVGFSINRAGDMRIVSTNDLGFGAYTENLGWQIGFGSFIRLSKYTNLDIMYKYADLGRMKTSNIGKTAIRGYCDCDVDKGRLRVHELSLGINRFF